MFKFSDNVIIGHRGCDSTAFNNTIEAFLKAIELGAEMIEFDVRKTRDNVLIIHHDQDVFGKRIRGNLFRDLKEIAEKNGLHLATLEEALKVLEGKVKLDIEIKEQGYEKEVVNLVLQYFTPAEFIVKSFHDESVLAIKKGFPGVTAGLLLGTGKHFKNDQGEKKTGFIMNYLEFIGRRWSEFFPWKRVKKCQADFIAPNWKLLIFGQLKAAQKRKVPVLVWTVDEKKLLKHFFTTNLIQGIITNKPELAVKIKKEILAVSKN